MTLTLFDRTAAITTTVTPSQAIALLAELPADIRVRIQPSVPPVRTVQEPQPAGYFGLAVALARRTWTEDEAWIQPIYTNCPNCGTVDHNDYQCPCGCHGRQ